MLLLGDLPVSYAATVFGGPVELDRVELLKFYLHLIEDFYAGYPWQVVASYNISIGCMVALVVLFIMFLIKVQIQQHRVKKEARLYAYYSDRLHAILGSAEELTHEQMLEMLGKTDEEIRENDTYYYANMLEEVRMDMYEIVCLPNMQTLAAHWECVRDSRCNC